MPPRILFFPLLFASCLPGQEVQACGPCPPPTKLETFLARKDTLVIKILDDVGSVGPVKVQALTAWEPGRRRFPTGGLIVTVRGEKGGGGSIIVDADELGELSRALWRLGTFTDDEALPEVTAEMTFSTRSDMQFLAARNGLPDHVRATVTLPGEHGEVRCTLDGEQLKQLKELADRAAQLLAPR